MKSLEVDLLLRVDLLVEIFKSVRMRMCLCVWTDVGWWDDRFYRRRKITRSAREEEGPLFQAL